VAEPQLETRATGGELDTRECVERREVGREPVHVADDRRTFHLTKDGKRR
jgi:hypothetical protein